MKHLWSPWRSRHIESLSLGPDPTDRTGPSLFSRLAAENDDEKNLIVWRGTRVFVIMNLYPYNNGHVMIVPFREVADYEELTAEEQVEVAATIGRCITWLKKALRPDGFNVGINIGSGSGAGIPTHLHVHVVPRWAGDTNFMATTGDVRVVPEAMEATYRKLLNAVSATESSENRTGDDR